MCCAIKRTFDGFFDVFKPRGLTFVRTPQKRVKKLKNLQKSTSLSKIRAKTSKKWRQIHQKARNLLAHGAFGGVPQPHFLQPTQRPPRTNAAEKLQKSTSLSKMEANC